MAIKVTYIYSACVRIDTPDVRIICDPWFTQGAYDGSWYQFPSLPDPIEKLGAADFVYVSHIHPDHYDPVFLRTYLARYPQARLLIAPFAHPHLLRKMQADGFTPNATGHQDVGETHLDLVPNEVPDKTDPNDIDSALIVRYRDQSVVNMNDNLWNAAHIERIKQLCPRPQIALLGYTGAGPYPQTYHDEPELLARLAEEKKQEFFGRYRRMRDALSPSVVIPFAGKYLLGGRLAGLNEFRGVADAVEVLQFDPAAVVLDDGGDASIDTSTLSPTRVRTAPYARADVQKFVDSISERPMVYEALIAPELIDLVPFMRLAKKAYDNALRMSTCTHDYYFCISLPSGWLVLNANPNNPSIKRLDSIDSLEPRSEVITDHRYLFGLMTCVFHWNNAEIGSHLRVRRHPNVFDRNAQRFLNFFSV